MAGSRPAQRRRPHIGFPGQDGMALKGVSLMTPAGPGLIEPASSANIRCDVINGVRHGSFSLPMPRRPFSDIPQGRSSPVSSYHILPDFQTIATDSKGRRDTLCALPPYL